MSKLLRNKRYFNVPLFEEKSEVVFDKGASDMPVLHEMMMSGYTPSTRVAQYHTDIQKGASDDEIFSAITDQPHDVTDVVNSANVKDLGKVVRKKEEPQVEESSK